MTPSGGVLMTVALRAMQAELDEPHFRLLSANTVFCSPVPHGPLEIRVEVLRRGRTAAQLRAALSSTSSPGPGLEVTGTFGRKREVLELDAATFPELPMPANATPLDDDLDRNPHVRWPFFRNFESRLAEGERWWRGDWKAGPARYSRWFRYRVPQMRADGTLDPLAVPPVADTMPAAVINALGPGTRRFYAPSLDLTIHFLDDTRSEWLLSRCYARRAHAGYATAETEIWSDERKLVAYGTQSMILVVPDASKVR